MGMLTYGPSINTFFERFSALRGLLVATSPIPVLGIPAEYTRFSGLFMRERFAYAETLRWFSRVLRMNKLLKVALFCGEDPCGLCVPSQPT